MRTSRRCMIGVLALAATLLCAVPGAFAVPQVDLDGATPSVLALNMSRSAFPAGAPAVVIAEETSWRDQLTGAGLAGAVRGPLLLWAGPTLPTTVAAELTRLSPTRAYLLTSSQHLAQLPSQVASALPDGAQVVVVRTDDAPRSARLVARLVAAQRSAAPTCALVVNPGSWPGAVSGAGLAAAGWPVLFADSARPGFNASLLRDLGISRAVVVGGQSPSLDAETAGLRAALGASGAIRISGADRYTLARTVANSVAPSAGLGFSAPVVVSGSTSAEAVLAGTLAARRGSATLLCGSAGIGNEFAADLFAHRAGVKSLAFVGSTSALPTRHRVEVQQALRARAFSSPQAMAHVKAIAGFGPRRAGSAAERKAANYLARKLAEYGYKVTIQTFPIPGGKTSRNIIAEKPGTSSDVIVLGAHLDSKYPSPGGNDNASGVAVTLELARCLAQADGLAPTVRFIGFGAEEVSGPRSTDHHFGSRHYVKSLSSSQLAAIEAMVSIDMVGYGSTFTARNLKAAPMTTVKSLQSWGTFTGQKLPYLKDPSRDGWSDHEAFEQRGIPVAWLEWRDDPVYHTRRDTYGHVSADRVRRSGRLVSGWLLDLTPAEVNALRP